MRPWTVRPPWLGRGRTNDFSGVDRVISAKSATLEPRRPGVVGLYLRIPITQFLVKVVSALGERTAEDVDRALFEGHDGTLGALALAPAELGALALANPVDGVDGVDLHGEDLLDRQFDFFLVRAGVDQEGVLAFVDQAVALLRDDGCNDDVARILCDGAAHLASSSEMASA